MSADAKYSPNGERDGKNKPVVNDPRTENSSSYGQNLALTGLFVRKSLDSEESSHLWLLDLCISQLRLESNKEEEEG